MLQGCDRSVCVEIGITKRHLFSYQVVSHYYRDSTNRTHVVRSTSDTWMEWRGCHSRECIIHAYSRLYTCYRRCAGLRRKKKVLRVPYRWRISWSPSSFFQQSMVQEVVKRLLVDLSLYSFHLSLNDRNLLLEFFLCSAFLVWASTSSVHLHEVEKAASRLEAI